MVIHFTCVISSILASTTENTTIFFTTPSYESNRSFWSSCLWGNQSKSFVTCWETTAIIISSSLTTSIPAVTVTTKNKNLFRVFCSLELSNDVIGNSIRYSVIFKEQIKLDGLSTLLHSQKHFSIFNCDCGCWNTRDWVTLIIKIRVAYTSSMRRLNAKRSNASY